MKLTFPNDKELKVFLEENKIREYISNGTEINCFIGTLCKSYRLEDHKWIIIDDKYEKARTVASDYVMVEEFIRDLFGWNGFISDYLRKKYEGWHGHVEWSFFLEGEFKEFLEEYHVPYDPNMEFCIDIPWFYKIFLYKDGSVVLDHDEIGKSYKIENLNWKKQTGAEILDKLEEKFDEISPEIPDYD